MKFTLKTAAKNIKSRFINEPKTNTRPFFKEEEAADLGDTKEFSSETEAISSLMEN